MVRVLGCICCDVFWIPPLGDLVISNTSRRSLECMYSCVSDEKLIINMTYTNGLSLYYLNISSVVYFASIWCVRSQQVRQITHMAHVKQLVCAN